MTDETPLPTGANYEYYANFTGKDTYTASEKAQIALLLEEALEVIFAFTGNNLASSTGSEIPAKNVQCRVARRYFENPDGIQSEGADGYSYARGGVIGDVALTDSEKSTLVNLGVKKSGTGWNSVGFSRGIRGSVW